MLGMNGAQVGVFEQTNSVGFSTASSAARNAEPWNESKIHFLFLARSVHKNKVHKGHLAEQQIG